MFSFLKRKKSKPKLFLKAIVVLPRNELSRIDEQGLKECHDLEGVVREKLEQLFDLPQCPSGYIPTEDDLAIEVVVPKLQGAEFTSLMISPYDIPIFWRPKIEILARLMYVKSGKTKGVIRVSEKLGWVEYWNKVFSFNGIFRIKPLFGASDMEALLYRAFQQLLRRLASEYGSNN